MSISTPQGGGSRRPSVIKTRATAGGKPTPPADEEVEETDADADVVADADPAPAKKTTRTVGRSTSRKAEPPASPARKKATAAKATRPAAKSTAKSGGRKPPTPIKPVKVTGGKNWGPTLLFVAVVVVALAIVGYGGYQVWQNGLTAQEKASRIDGIINYNNDPKQAELLKGAQHQWGPITYDIKPPVGGPHNQNWMRCLGDVYPAPIAAEHAVHAMEHGAVWITYRPDLPADQVETLAKKVRGNDYTLMSPYEGMDSPISIQAWGYKLKVDSAGDARLDAFIRALRQQVGPEQGATCSSGSMITETGTTPRDLGKEEPAAQPSAGG